MSAYTRESPQQGEENSFSAQYKPVFDSSEVPALETCLSLCVSAVSGNAGGRNQEHQVFSVCPGSALAMGLTGNHYHYPAVTCLWLANLSATFIRLLKEMDVEDKESLGIQLPAENVLSKLPACS